MCGLVSQGLVPHHPHPCWCLGVFKLGKNWTTDITSIFCIDITPLLGFRRFLWCLAYNSIQSLGCVWMSLPASSAWRSFCFVASSALSASTFRKFQAPHPLAMSTAIENGTVEVSFPMTKWWFSTITLVLPRVNQSWPNGTCFIHLHQPSHLSPSTRKTRSRAFWARCRSSRSCISNLLLAAWLELLVLRRSATCFGYTAGGKSVA